MLDKFDKETLEKMTQAHCIGMKFGVESANQEILKRIGKPLNLEKLKQALKDYGIAVN